MSGSEPIRITRNQYRGVNAHLHSHWQKNGGWAEFHTNYISQLRADLRLAVRPMGYTVGLERSLQVRRPGGDTGQPEADLTVYDPDRLRQARPSHHPSAGAGASLVLAVPEMLGITLEPSAPYRAVAIYQVPKVDQARGEPVAWIEVLSPSNKPGGQDAQYYKDRRLELLQGNIVFVEVDLLHESLSTFEGIANYRIHESDSHPYRISVIDPRPVFMDGVGFTYEFDVDAAFPSVQVPLNADDLLEFYFGAAYDDVLEVQGYAEDYVNYRQLPERFDRYSEADQARIVTRMLHIIERAGRDDAFTEAPQELPTLPLQDALARLEQFQSA